MEICFGLRHSACITCSMATLILEGALHTPFSDRNFQSPSLVPPLPFFHLFISLFNDKGIGGQNGQGVYGVGDQTLPSPFRADEHGLTRRNRHAPALLCFAFTFGEGTSTRSKSRRSRGGHRNNPRFGDTRRIPTNDLGHSAANTIERMGIGMAAPFFSIMNEPVLFILLEMFCLRWLYFVKLETDS